MPPSSLIHAHAVSNACTQLAMMQPTDTVLTRMYNQPTIPTPDGRHVGALYKNPLDCLWKTLKAEGPLGWYKGAGFPSLYPREPELKHS